MFDFDVREKILRPVGRKGLIALKDAVKVPLVKGMCYYSFREKSVDTYNRMLLHFMGIYELTI